MNARQLIFFSPSPMGARLAALEQIADFRRILHYEPPIDGLSPLIGSGVSLSRSTPATYVNDDGQIVESAVNGHRYGLLEPAGRNLLLNSESLSSWTPSAVTITSNVETAPDGTLTADRVAGSGTTDGHGVSQTHAVETGKSYTFSFHLKEDTATYAQIFFGSTSFFTVTDYANFDLANGLITKEGVVGNARIRKLKDGWYRVSVKAVATATGTATVFLRIVSSGTAARNENNSLSTGFFAWGGQSENRKYPTSYKKTTSAAVDRSADTFSITRPAALSAQEDFTAIVRFETVFGEDEWTAGSQMRLGGDLSPLLEVTPKAGSPDVWSVGTSGFTAGSDQSVDLGQLSAGTDHEILIESDADGLLTVHHYIEGVLEASDTMQWSELRDEADEFGGTELFKYQALDAIILRSVIFCTGRMTYEQMRSYRRA